MARGTLGYPRVPWGTLGCPRYPGLPQGAPEYNGVPWGTLVAQDWLNFAARGGVAASLLAGSHSRPQGTCG